MVAVSSWLKSLGPQNTMRCQGSGDSGSCLRVSEALVHGPAPQDLN